MNILIYYPYNSRSVALQSEIEMFINSGHRVFLLTTCARGELHTYVEGLRGTVGSYNGRSYGKIGDYVAQFLWLWGARMRYKADIVIAHQQAPALIAGALRMFAPCTLIYVRHNTDEDYPTHPLKAWSLNRLVNILTPIKIAPSSIVLDFWVRTEKVKPEGIHRINYGYNFSQYEKSNQVEVRRIRGEYPARTLVLSIARLVPAKRHLEMLKVIRRLVDEGEDVKMICLGTGHLATELTEFIRHQGLCNAVFLVGRKANVFDYIEASDVFMHLSSSEASNSAVKEVALLSKPVIVCRGVGDFEDYIVHEVNGFLLPHKSPSEEAYKVLHTIIKCPQLGIKMGAALRNTVLNTFGIERIADQYNSLLQAAYTR